MGGGKRRKEKLKASKREKIQNLCKFGLQTAPGTVMPSDGPNLHSLQGHLKGQNETQSASNYSLYVCSSEILFGSHLCQPKNIRHKFFVNFAYVQNLSLSYYAIAPNQGAMTGDQLL